MLKLRLNNTSPTWLDLQNGVRVQVPPLGVAALRAAEHAAVRAYSEGKDALGLLDGDQLPDEAVSDLEGIFAQARIRALAAKILAWEGIAGEDGADLPITPEALDAFAAHPALGPVFAREYDRSTIELVTEGNDSGLDGPGKPRAAKRIAAAAPPDAPSAPAP